MKKVVVECGRCGKAGYWVFVSGVDVFVEVPVRSWEKFLLHDCVLEDED